jgi:hypothetical protein
MEHADPGERSAHDVIVGMARGLLVAKALQVAAELGIADLLASGPRPVAELAAAAGCHPRALRRVLRALASQGVFRDVGEGRFENTPRSEVLRAEQPGSVRDYVIQATSNGTMRAFLDFREVVRTGKHSFAAGSAQSPFELMRRKPGYATTYSRAMMAKGAPAVAALLEAYDFSACRSLVDVGGGNGHVLAAVLERYPALRGVVLEQPPMAPCAREHLASRGVADRAEVAEGDFFAAVPAGHDTYLLKNVLHDWDDEDAARILGSCRAAMAPGARLLVLEAVLRDDNEASPAKWIDLHMMTVLGGLERTEPEWGALLAATGFRLTRVVPLRGAISALEALAE